MNADQLANHLTWMRGWQIGFQTGGYLYLSSALWLLLTPESLGGYPPLGWLCVFMSGMALAFSLVLKDRMDAYHRA